jgi:hypothetical protein
MAAIKGLTASRFLDIHLQKQNALALHVQRNGGLTAEAGDQLFASKGFEGALGGSDNSGNLLLGLHLMQLAD